LFLVLNSYSFIEDSIFKSVIHISTCVFNFEFDVNLDFEIVFNMDHW
jgi:hypothetical protein